MSIASTAAATAVGGRGRVDGEHEYLRTQVDPLLMPLIEALLLYQPTSIYEFLIKFLDGAALGAMKHVAEVKKSTKARRHRMVEYMSATVLPLMDDLTQRILQTKPSDAKEFLRDIVQARLLANPDEFVSASSPMTFQSFKVGDRVECRFKGRPKYLPATVQAIDNNGASVMYTIHYDNGKTEEHIHPILLRSISRRENIQPVLLLLGLDGAGKSTFLSTMQGDLDKDVPPTAGFSSVKFQLSNGTATFYDLGGGPTIRAMWREYFADAHGVIYVVDASDTSRLKESAEMLKEAMTHPMLNGKPLLILANKIDRMPAFSEVDFSREMQAEAFADKKIVQVITKASANGNLVDDRLESGLGWILNRIEEAYDDLEAKVAQDKAAKKAQDDAAWQAQKERVWAYKEERERGLMLLEDSPKVQQLYSKKEDEAKKATNEDQVPMCTSCQTQPAVTKCSASKWMPVCGDCAAMLKKKQ
ncbi:unnamed protein product [Aphanomyces euteiches]